MIESLEGLPLDYLIGAEAQQGKAGRITEVSYRSPKAKLGISIAYCNLFLEEYADMSAAQRARYAPFRKKSDTAEEYNEGEIDPTGPGWALNLKEQFARRKQEGFEYIELDNPDAYTVKQVLGAIDLAESYGLKVICKNPLLMEGDAVPYVSRCHGVIVEKGAGNPADMDALRIRAGKASLPVWFVAFIRGSSNGLKWARDTATEAKKYLNMSVTHSPDGEYTSVEDILLPVSVKPGDSDMNWRVAQSLLTLRDQVNKKWPDRNKENDGTIGDASHSARSSDHNPDDNGVVRAMDITHDPKHGLDSYELAETLRQNRDPRIKYIISNRHIISATQSPWVPRPYHGSNPHDHHVHVSVVSGALADTTSLWDIERHVVPPPIPRPVPLPPDSGRFAACMKGLAIHEGGRDDDPQDDGGRTGYGVTQSEWDRWRLTHHGLPSDVWNAPKEQVQILFRQWYWDILDCDRLPVGVDYSVFDYGVNSGVEKSARMLQKLLHVGVDGHIGPITEAAAAQAKAADLINSFCDARMTYLRAHHDWPHFHNGWTTRVADVRRDSLAALGK